MGFDIECIIDIQTYPGEYFCPVCRTLVYPNEALQSQCSHLYCKPCLAHIANGSKACPYDGYLVTESDSKPLIDSDKALVEKIGKVKVHCLFFRSGCTWEGTLSECTSHCSECSFGSSPVICNRCGVQIVHRQVHDHAQNCPGVYEAQPTAGVVPGATSAVTVSSANTTDLNQTVAQSGGQPLSQPQNPQNATVTQQTGQYPNQPPIVNPQAQVVAPVSVPTTEQWYQQQYQNYYQQYAGYNPYQHSQQQYYSLQQQPLQQYPQNPLPVHGQPPSQAYIQPLAQPLAQLPVQLQPPPQAQPLPQARPQAQPQHILQTQQQPNFQQLAQGQAQSLPPAPQAPSHVQVPPQPQLRPPMQTVTPNYQVNPQQQPPPQMRPQAQAPTQFPLPPPQNQPTQPPSYAQTMSLQPTAQHPQAHQLPMQMHHSHASQAHLHPQIHPQPQFQNQTPNQSHLQIQQQAPQYNNQNPRVHPPPPNQPIVTAAPRQPSHLPASSVSGYQSFPQPQPVEQIQSGTSYQYQMNLHSTSVPLHPVQMQGQVPQQPSMVRPPPSHGSLPLQQPSTFLPPHTQVPGIPLAHQQISTHAQPPIHHPQHGTITQTGQAFPMQSQHHFTPGKDQLHQQSQYPQQQLLQPQLRLYSSHQSLQSQNHAARPMMSSEGVHSQNYPQSSAGFGAVVHTGPAQLGSNLTSTNQNFVKSAVLEKKDSFSNKHVSEDGLPGQGLLEKEVIGSDVEPSKEEALLNNNKSGVHKTVSSDSINDDVNGGAAEKLSGALSFETRTAKVNGSEEDSHSGTGSHIPQQVDREGQKEAGVMGPSSKDFDKVPHIPLSRPEASEITASTPNSGRAPGYYGHPPPQGPTMTTRDDTLCIMGKTAQLHRDGQSGLQAPVRTSDAAISKDQRDSSSYLSGSGEKIPPLETYGNELSLRRTSRDTDIDSLKIGPRDHLNPISLQPTRSHDQALRPLDKALPRSSYDTEINSNSGVLEPLSRFLPAHHPSVGHSHADALGPSTEFGHQMKHFPTLNPDGDYLGISPHGFGGLSSFPRGTSAFDDINAREAKRFGEGSRSFNLPLDPVGNSFNDRRFPHIPGHLRGDEIDGPKNLGFGEYMTRGPLHNHIRSDDAVGKDGPGPLARGEFSSPRYFSGHFMSDAAGPGIFSGHSHVGELGGQGNFHRHIPFGESIRGDRPSVPLFGNPSLRSSHPIQGILNAGSFMGEVDSFDQSWKRKPISMGWCRICKCDCETVEGLEMHSQTREHQKMSMDMVKFIKHNSKKKQRTAAGHVAHDGGSRSRKVGFSGRGNKP